MDDLECRLSDALAREAATINPETVNPDSRRWELDRNRVLGWRRPTSLAWTAVAAAVVVIAVGITIIVGGVGVSHDASGPVPVTPTGASSVVTKHIADVSVTKSCDSGWTAYPGAIIQTGNSAVRGNSDAVAAGSVAILRFAGGNPPQPALCALVVNGTRTTADGATSWDGSPLGYLSSMSGDQSFIIGAFHSPVSSVTFSDRELSWTVTVTPSTTGLVDLDNGWYGYVILAPALTADVEAVAKGADGSTLGSKQLSFGGGSVGPPSPETAPGATSASTR